MTSADVLIQLHIMLTTLLTPLFFAAFQEPSLVSGAYRGPVDETQVEIVSFSSGAISPFGHVYTSIDSVWDRWEYWYEGEREFLASTTTEFGAGRNQFLIRSIPLVIEATLSDDPAVREAAVLSLGRIAYPAATSFIIDATQDSNESVRQAAYVALGLMSTHESALALVDVFMNTADSNAKGFAAIGMGLSGRIEASVCLDNFFGHVVTMSSWKGIDDLLIASLVAASENTRIDYSDNLMAIVNVMEDRGASSEAQVAAINALAATSNKSAHKEVVNSLLAKNEDVVVASIAALGHLKAKYAVAKLISMFESTHNPRLHGIIQIALGQIASSDSVEFLINNKPSLANELYVRTTWMIAVGFAQISETYTQVADTLLYGSDFNKHDDAVALRNDEYELRGAAALSLGLYARPAARVQLEQCLKQPELNKDLLGNIATALGMLGTKQANNILNKNADLFMSSTSSRRGYATALGMCQNTKSKMQLTQMLINGKDPTVRWTSARAMSNNHNEQALVKLLLTINEDIGAAVVSDRLAHLIMSIGYISSASNSGTLGANVDHRQQNAMLNCLRSY